MDHDAADDLTTRIEDALNANESRKLALMEYISKLERQIADVDTLIDSAEAHIDVPDDMESDEELPHIVSIPNAITAIPPISPGQLEDIDSPFYHSSRRHRLYNDLTSARNWTEAENTALKDAVQREGMRYHAFQLQSQGYNALTALENVPLESYGELRDHLDWERIARYVPNRLPSMCKVQWLSNLHPGVQRGPWSEEERVDLLRAVKEARKGSGNFSAPTETGNEDIQGDTERSIDWEVVAGYLANGRIAVDCMKAYRATAGRAIPTVWTAELDAELLQAVEKYGENNMTTVAMSMPISIGRQQCINRYEVLVDKRVAGKWSKEEDIRLKTLLEEVPPETESRWKIIADRMKTRSERQCRARFRDVLDDSYRRDDWSESEDQIIQETLAVSTASNRKPDIKRLAQQLNRPIEKLRKRVIAFSNGQTPKRTFQRGKAEKGPSERPHSKTPKTRASETPDSDPMDPLNDPKRSQIATQSPKGEQDDSDPLFGGIESSDEADSEYEEEISTREARKRRLAKQHEAQTKNLRRVRDGRQL